MSPTTATPQSLSNGLAMLRQQLTAPFLSTQAAPVANPVAFGQIRDAGLDAKDNLRNRFSSRP